MIKGIFLPVIILLAVSCYAQESDQLRNFKSAFTKALNKDFSEDQLAVMLDENDEMLVARNGYMTGDPKVNQYTIYPLYNFRKENLYTRNITTLLSSSNPYQRTLAYMVIGASGDESKEKLLLQRLQTEKDHGSLAWVANALFYLGTNHTTLMFDYLVAQENLGDAHAFPLYIMLNKDSIRQTSYNRIHSDNEKEKILAVQALAVTAWNDKTDKLLREAVAGWDIRIKGYAIYSVKELQMGNLLGLLQPLLKDTRTAAISLEALANSPDATDRNFLIGLVNQQDIIEKEYLDAFFHSKNMDNLRYWLKLLYTRRLPANYVFLMAEQPLLDSDDLLPAMQEALQSCTNPATLSRLVETLKQRTDDKSVGILISLLKSQHPSVRNAAAKVAQENPSDKLKDPEVDQLVKQGLLDN